MRTMYCSFFLAGFGFGAAVAAALTPKSGAELRTDVRDKVACGLGTVKAGIDDARQRVAREAKRIDKAVTEGVAAYRDGRVAIG